MLHFFTRELTLSLRHGGEWLVMLALYFIMLSAFVLAQPAGEIYTHGEITGILWVCALIVLGLSHHRMYERDFEDGTLEQWAFLPIATEWLVAMKCLAHWLTAALPLVLLSPLLWVMLGGDMEYAHINVRSDEYSPSHCEQSEAIQSERHGRDIVIRAADAAPLDCFVANAPRNDDTQLIAGKGLAFLLSLALGTMCFTLIGSLAAAASLRAGNRQLLTLMLSLPLAVPALIFGTGGSLPLLLAYTLMLMPLSVWATRALLNAARD